MRIHHRHLTSYTEVDDSSTVGHIRRPIRGEWDEIESLPEDFDWSMPSHAVMERRRRVMRRHGLIPPRVRPEVTSPPVEPVYPNRVFELNLWKAEWWMKGAPLDADAVTVVNLLRRLGADPHVLGENWIVHLSADRETCLAVRR